ncbi:hypothetical protein O1L60_44915 [Streptomyces diastatochromogenes]|nr:hypothetical protein [Streptomyces diastatochromogenes]
MPKDSRARVNAVRAVMAETGLRYNQAALELDRRAGAAGDQPDSEPRRLHVLPFLVYCTVPASADRAELAQDLADRLHTLRRESTGEEYAGRADVIVPASPWAPEPQLPGYVSALLLVHAWAVRPWDRKGEADAVISDFYAVARAWVTDRYPAVPVEGHPVALPLGRADAEALAASAEFTAHTEGEYTDLPEGWEELIAARRAEVAAGRVDGDPRASSRAGRVTVGRWSRRACRAPCPSCRACGAGRRRPLPLSPCRCRRTSPSTSTPGRCGRTASSTGSSRGGTGAAVTASTTRTAGTPAIWRR